MSTDVLLPPLARAAVDDALARFAAAVREAYGARLAGPHFFGSRARGDHRPDSDADVAVVLAGPLGDRWAEKDRLIGLAIDPIIDTGLQIQPWPFSQGEWTGGSTPLAASARAEAVPLGPAP